MLMSAALGIADLSFESLLWISNTAESLFSSYLSGHSLLFFVGSPFYREHLNVFPQGFVLGPPLFLYTFSLSNLM